MKKNRIFFCIRFRTLRIFWDKKSLVNFRGRGGGGNVYMSLSRTGPFFSFNFFLEQFQIFGHFWSRILFIGRIFMPTGIMGTCLIEEILKPLCTIFPWCFGCLRRPLIGLRWCRETQPLGRLNASSTTSFELSAWTEPHQTIIKSHQITNYWIMIICTIVLTIL